MTSMASASTLVVTIAAPSFAVRLTSRSRRNAVIAFFNRFTPREYTNLTPLPEGGLDGCVC